MNSFIFALNATLPIVLTVIIGYVLKRIGLIKEELAKAMNKLVFRVFLPAMLFLNVYKIESFSSIDFKYIIYALAATLVIFIACLIYVIVFVKEDSQKGVILQAAFRSNYALIGIPLAESLFGDTGAIVATVLSAFVVPFFNVLAVISLTIFGGKPNPKKVALGIAKNPLIIGILSGFVMLLIRALLVRWNIDFRLTDITPIYKVLTSLSNVATPLALVVLGAQFEFSAIPTMKKQIVTAVIIRNVIIPTAGITVAYLIGGFTGAEFAAFVSLFGTPVAVSSVPMAQEMGADSALAGQIVIFTTIISSFTIFILSFILKELGIFV